MKTEIDQKFELAVKNNDEDTIKSILSEHVLTDGIIDSVLSKLKDAVIFVNILNLIVETKKNIPRHNTMVALLEVLAITAGSEVIKAILAMPQEIFKNTYEIVVNAWAQALNFWNEPAIIAFLTMEPNNSNRLKPFSVCSSLVRRTINDECWLCVIKLLKQLAPEKIYSESITNEEKIDIIVDFCCNHYQDIITSDEDKLKLKNDVLEIFPYVNNLSFKPVS